jgi:hypothetical protein
MVHLTAKNVPSSVVTPFVRAVMRREARLLLKDADGMGDEAWEPRTADQRRADAFADVLLSVAAAVRYIQRDDPVHAELSSDRPSPLPDSS